MRLVFLLSFIFSGFSFAASDEAILGKNEGYPVCKLPQGPTEERCLVGMLSHFDEIVPARKVPKAAVPRALKRAAAEPSIAYTFRNTAVGSVDGFLDKSRDTGLLILQSDSILVERYQYDRKATDRFQSYSMAKTVVGMLVGIALHEGKIKSIEQKAEEFVPQLKGHPYGETSLRHLLTMSSGIQFSERYDGMDDVTVLGRKTLAQQGPGGVDSVLSFTTREAPAGTRFHYASSESEVLGLVLRAATGRTLSDYLAEKIWQPMGAEADASWLMDAGGYELGFMGINATLRDWGRLGLLLANDGAIDGKQLIPAAWVKAATTPEADYLKVGVATQYNGYGYQTWLIDRTERRFALLGIRGQGVFIDPATKLVIVHTAVQSTAANDPLRAEQFVFFYATLRTLAANKP